MTPTVNTQLPLNLGKFNTLIEALDYAAQGDTGVNFFDSFGQLITSWSYSTLQTQAIRYALQLQSQGILRNDKVAIIAQTRVEFLATFFACQYLGAIPCPLPFTVFLGGKAAYVEKLKHMLQLAKPAMIVSPENIVECAISVVEPTNTKVITFERLVKLTDKGNQQDVSTLNFPNVLKASDSAYIQFSSGSTTHPKGILISQQAISANIQAILRDGMKLEQTDRAFSWLPFYHDMGLVGLMLAAVSGQRSVDYLSPTTFARRPALWLDLMSQNKSTITFAPAFGYQLALQRLKPEQNIDLSTLRIAGIGGDMIRAETLESFTQELTKHQFNPQALMPSYGMAEATLAITMVDVNEIPQIDTLKQDGKSKRVVSCGKALPDYKIKITDDSKVRLPEREIGQIWVKGPSVVFSYLDSQQNPTPDADGYMNTGDLGYLSKRQLYVTGREKDLIIIYGRNIWAQDIEWHIQQLIPELRHGDVIAMDIEGAQEDVLVILIQYKETIGQAKQDDLKKEVQTAINQSSGVQAQVFLVPPHSLSMTSSGKLARAQIKNDYLQNKLTIL